MANIQITVDVGDTNKNPAKVLRKLDKELSKYLESNLGPDLVKEYQKTTTGWNSPPDFKNIYKETSVQGNKVLTVGPYGRGKTKWQWVSDGTRRRVIMAKNPNGMMKFPRNYIPKTTASGYWGGPGLRYGPTVLAKRVVHQIEARKFSEKIKNAQEPIIKIEVDRLVRRVVK